MSEHEFEFYLSLLGRFLRLSPQQREQIADELRDHFQERLEELTHLGHSREEAVRVALEEFGDAAGLAAHFTFLAQRKKRRLVMRCTLGSIGVAAAALLLANAFWPEAPPGPAPSRAVAQQKDQGEGGYPQKTTPRVSKDDRQAEIEAKLATRIPKLELMETPAKDALQFISDQIQVDILINKAFFQDENELPLDTPITLKIRHTAVSARTALELVLEQLSPRLGYTIRDGLIYLTFKNAVDEVQVYDCRDLLGGSRAMQTGLGLAGVPGLGGRMPGGMGLGEGGMGPGGMGPGGGYGVAEGPGDGLVRVITATIHPETWPELGGNASIEEFNGLLIVKHSQSVHREIKHLLELIRTTAKEARQEKQ